MRTQCTFTFSKVALTGALSLWITGSASASEDAAPQPATTAHTVSAPPAAIQTSAHGKSAKTMKLNADGGGKLVAYRRADGSLELRCGDDPLLTPHSSAEVANER